MDLWAVVPVKERDRAKERLAPLLPPEMRQALALAMLEDVLAALTSAAGLAGLLVVTVDPAATQWLGITGRASSKTEPAMAIPAPLPRRRGCWLRKGDPEC
jgi:hypothetical protein